MPPLQIKKCEQPGCGTEFWGTKREQFCPRCKKIRAATALRRYQAGIVKPDHIRVETYRDPDPLRPLMWKDGICRRCKSKMFEQIEVNEDGWIRELKCIICGEFA